ncbi:guanylate kinase [Hypnocyclicus thermotrophus]|uniref:Guanylate kinase n=1 Tax=Hypnocyclicus thermotrophus TaxID=1627895 RepID=A0AA46I4Y8_9FUSO|nr:guanylate kinase [Hypnocyclicus thermotrophus]
MKGRLFIVSGPSGAGKSTVTKLVRKKLNMTLAVSATTRKPRVGEVDTVDYHFYSMEKFQEAIKNNEFLEYANVHGNYYGTLKKEVEKKLENGEDVILEIDVQGGLQVKEKFPEAKLIFFKAPSVEELEKRLRGRNTDTEEVIQTRLKNSLKEMEYEKYYEEVIINNNVEESIKKLIEIIKRKEKEEK